MVKQHHLLRCNALTHTVALCLRYEMLDLYVKYLIQMCLIYPMHQIASSNHNQLMLGGKLVTKKKGANHYTLDKRNLHKLSRFMPIQ
jgi:hypothetical protein